MRYEMQTLAKEPREENKDTGQYDSILSLKRS